MSGGHEAVKAAVVAHVAANVAAWVATTQEDSWPPAPSLVAATAVLPVDEDKPWPCVLVSSTATPRISQVGDGTYLAEYTLNLRVGVRSDEMKNYDKAVEGRDRLLLAVRRLLLSSPRCAAGVVTLAASITETTDDVALDTKGRPVALGTLSVTVRQSETLPDPAAVDVLTADVEVTAVDATHTTL